MHITTIDTWIHLPSVSHVHRVGDLHLPTTQAEGHGCPQKFPSVFCCGCLQMSQMSQMCIRASDHPTLSSSLYRVFFGTKPSTTLSNPSFHQFRPSELHHLAHRKAHPNRFNSNRLGEVCRLVCPLSLTTSAGLPQSKLPLEGWCPDRTTTPTTATWS